MPSVSIGSSCFNGPISWFREVFEQDSVWRRFTGYVGYHDDEPVSTAAVVVGAEWRASTTWPLCPEARAGKDSRLRFDFNLST